MGPRSWRGKSSEAPALAQVQSLHATTAPGPLTVEGEVSKGGRESIHDEHSPDGHVGHSLHPALGGPEVNRSWNCHVHTPDFVPGPPKLASTLQNLPPPGSASVRLVHTDVLALPPLWS